MIKWIFSAMSALHSQFLLISVAAVPIITMNYFFFTFNNNETEKELKACDISAQRWDTL